MSRLDYPVSIVEEGKRAYKRGITVDPPYGGRYLEAYDYGYFLAQEEERQKERVNFSLFLMQEFGELYEP